MDHGALHLPAIQNLYLNYDIPATPYLTSCVCSLDKFFFVYIVLWVFCFC